MPGLVGTYPIVPFTTPVNGDDLDAAVVVSHDNTTAAAFTSHDADGTIHLQSSTLAARAGAGIAGRKWLTTDGLRVYYDTGAVWSEIDYLCKTAGGTVAGASTFSGGLTSAGAFLVSGAASALASLDTTNGAAADTNAIHFKRGGAIKWRIGNNVSGTNVDELNIYNDALGGSALKFANTTGAATFIGAVTMGALTATTGTFSGAVSMTALTATTGLFSAGGGQTVVVRGSDVSGAYIALVNSTGATARGFVGNGSSIFAGGAVTDFGIASEGGDLLFATTGGTVRGRFSAGGVLLVGTTLTTSAAGGDVVIANVRSIRGVNAAGTATKHLISINAADTVYVGFDIPGAIALGAPASVTGAGAGDVVIGTAKALRAANNAGTGTIRLIESNAADQVVISSGGQTAVFGGPVAVPSANKLFLDGGGDTYLWESSANTLQVFAGNVAGIILTAGNLNISNVSLTAGAITMGGALAGVTSLAMSSTLTGATRVESGKFKGNSAAPGIANGVAIGTGGAVSTAISGTDAAGKITIVAGNASLTNGSLCTVTFNSAYSSAPFVVLHYVNSGSTTVLAYGVANVSTTGFTIDVPLTPTSGQAYTFYYTVIQ